MKTRSEIENIANELLCQTVGFRCPVQVEAAAEQLGLRVESAALGDDVSGVLVLHGANATIGYNEDHHKVRQRFSIAHELGHYYLHAKEAHKSGLFIDRVRQTEFRRDASSSTGQRAQEVEANRFAAALLMPERLVRDAVAEYGSHIDEGDEDVLAELAARFEVSTQAMSVRLAALGLFDS